MSYDNRFMRWVLINASLYLFTRNSMLIKLVLGAVIREISCAICTVV